MQNFGMPGNSNSSSQPPPGAHQNTPPLPNPQLGMWEPSQIMGGPNPMANFIGNSTMEPPQVMPNLGPSIADMQTPTEQAWQQLLQSLKSPASAQQQQQVLAILRENPQFMAAFIKARVTQQQQLNH